MRDLPSGTVTFLFTDIEGSTRLLERLGDALRRRARTPRRDPRRGDRRARWTGRRHPGRRVLRRLPAAADAAEAAAAGQRRLADETWPDGAEVRVRVGLHTGEPTLSHGRYVGVDVHRAARVCAAAHGGQIVLTQATRAMLSVADILDLGEHRLKDLPAADAAVRAACRGARACLPAAADAPEHEPAAPADPVDRARPRVRGAPDAARTR